MGKVFGFSAALLLATSTATFAADIYRPETGGYKDGPVYVTNTWTGFYAGVNGGYGFTDGEQTNYKYYSTRSGASLGNIKAPYTVEASGAFGGGQIGYNYQMGRLVIGAEADIQGADIKDSGSGIAINDPLDTYSLKANVNWFGTVRGRIGYAFDQTLVYATGGFAYGEIETDNSYFFAFPFGGGPMTGRSKQTSTETGYTVGGGLEQKLSPNWSVKAEYQYIDLGSVGVDTTIFYQGAPNGVRQHTDLDTAFHTARVGLNYHFNNEYQPLK